MGPNDKHDSKYVGVYTGPTMEIPMYPEKKPFIDILPFLECSASIEIRTASNAKNNLDLRKMLRVQDVVFFCLCLDL